MTDTTATVSAVMVGDHHMRITCPNGGMLVHMQYLINGPGITVFNGTITLSSGLALIPAELFSAPGQAVELFNQITDLVAAYAAATQRHTHSMPAPFMPSSMAMPGGMGVRSGF